VSLLTSYLRIEDNNTTTEWIHAKSLYMWPHSDPEPNCTMTARVRPPDLCSVCRSEIRLWFDQPACSLAASVQTWHFWQDHYPHEISVCPVS